MPSSIPTHWLIDFPTYWISFWTLVNIALPPRELLADASEITQKRYNIFLKWVAYYGALNLRQVTVKLYSAVQTAPVSNEEARGMAKGIEAAKDAVADIPKPIIKGDS